jgi:LysM repeat protein
MTFDLSALRQKLSKLTARPGKIGAGLVVPLVAAGLITAGFPGLGTYTIRSGDTLTEIADRYGTTVRNLVRINELPGHGNTIYVGETLKVPGGKSTGVSKPRGRTVAYTVKRGDTLSEIAHRHKVSLKSLLAANGLKASSPIYAGRTLRIPGTAKTAPSKKCTKRNCFNGRRYADHVVAAADRNRAKLSKRDLPTRSQMRSIIASTARRHGVDPNLALAIAWQESGWKQRVVSPANAIGAMQVIPSSGRFSSDIIGRRLDLLNARDNATAGVVLLDWLTRAATVPNAVAGYYQGLGSVRKNGMFTDTKRYVSNVLRIQKKLQQGWNPLR